MPIPSTGERAIAAARDLTNILRQPSPAAPLAPIAADARQALTQLATIFSDAAAPPALLPPPGFAPLPATMPAPAPTPHLAPRLPPGFPPLTQPTPVPTPAPTTTPTPRAPHPRVTTAPLPRVARTATTTTVPHIPSGNDDVTVVHSNTAAPPARRIVVSRPVRRPLATPIQPPTIRPAVQLLNTAPTPAPLPPTRPAPVPIGRLQTCFTGRGYGSTKKVMPAASPPKVVRH